MTGESHEQLAGQGQSVGDKDEIEDRRRGLALMFGIFK